MRSVSRLLLGLLLTMLVALAGVPDAVAESQGPATSQDASAGSPGRTAGTVELVLFWEPGCPYCQHAKAFLASRRETKDWLRVQALDVSSQDGLEPFQRAVELFAVDPPAVPLIIVGGQPFVGFNDAATTGAEIIAAAGNCRSVDCPTFAELLAKERPGIGGQPGIDPEIASGTPTGPGAIKPLPHEITVPIIGKVALASLSLPALTVLLAAVDGFNPCAMWVLVFLIGLLVGIEDRARMWVLGGAFLLSSGLVYFVFLAAWLNLFVLLGALFWVRVAVAIVALGSGAYYLHGFATNAAAECQVTNPAQRQRIMGAMRASVTEKRFLSAIVGIVVLAAAVNLIELLCSAGIPAVFTQVLSMSALPAWHHYLYLLLYVIVFMLDDAAIFILAMLTLAATGMTNRYLRLTHLIGGIAMLAIGGLLLVAPHWLSFNP